MADSNVADTVDSAQPRRRASSVLAVTRRFLASNGMLLVLILMVIGAWIAYPGFIAPQNISNIISQNAPIGIVAVGMTIVIIGGGFDLSVGSIFALGATFFASFALQVPWPFALVGALVGGLVVGIINGVVVAWLRVNPFVATLGSGSIITGALLVYSNSAPFSVSAPGFQDLGAGKLGPIPIATIMLVTVIVAGAILLSRTVYGRSIYALGGNAEATRLSGLPVDLIRASTYALSGVLSAFAGVLLASRLSVGQANMGATTALDAIAIVVVGGTSLLGGEGGMSKTVIGLLILATLSNMFFSLAIDANWQLIAKGTIIIGAVALDAFGRRRTG
jgi:ribose transport system permease protein